LVNKNFLSEKEYSGNQGPEKGDHPKHLAGFFTNFQGSFCMFFALSFGRAVWPCDVFAWTTSFSSFLVTSPRLLFGDGLGFCLWPNFLGFSIERAMKHEYHEGPDARKKFDDGIAKLFRAPKTPVKGETPKPVAKPKKTRKD
jgi:hypothetical protein